MKMVFELCVVLSQLSIKHPGAETVEMITPVKIKVNLTQQERKRLSFEDINHINLEVNHQSYSVIDIST